MTKPRKPQFVSPGKDARGNPRPGRWRTKIDGKFHYAPPELGKKDIGEAWIWLRDLERKELGRSTAGTDPTVYWLCQLYLEWAESERNAGRLSIGQYKGQTARIKLFLSHPGIGDRKARLVHVDDLEAFFADLVAKGYSQHYVAGVGRTVRTLFRWGAKAIPGRTPIRLLTENPLTGYDFPRAPGAVRGYLEGKVVRRFFRWAWAMARAETELSKSGRPRKRTLTRRFDRLFILMLRFQRLTGCRPGEACGLLWTDIDIEGGRIIIPKERHKTGRKTGKDRTIHLTPPVVRLLEAIRRLPDHHPTHVFTHRRGNRAESRGNLEPLAGEPWPSGSAASAKVRSLREKAVAAKLEGIEEVGPKKLVAYLNRHGYISEAISSGMTHEQTAKLVGNTSQVLGQIYAHAIEQQDAERAKKLMERGQKKGRSSS